ncbi:MAG: hypothetical protein ACOCWO_04365, partial [Candidatus Muiribacteriaceae bacterium]
QTGNLIRIDLPNVKYSRGEINESVYKGTVMFYKTQFIDDERNSLRILITLTDPVPFKVKKIASSLKIIINKTGEEMEDDSIIEARKQKLNDVQAKVIYDKATDAMRFMEWEKAYQYLKDALVLDPDNEEIKKGLDIAQEKVFEKKVYDERLKQAFESYSEGDYMKAIDLLERFNEQYGATAASNYYLGKSYFEIKEYGKAREVLEWVQEKHPAFEFISTAQELLERIDYYLENDVSAVDLIDFAAENKDVRGVISALLYGTGFKFQFEEDVNRYVTVDISRKSLKEALDIVAEQAGLDYEIENKLITISKKRMDKKLLDQIGFQNMELSDVLDTVADFMNINIILSPDVDSTKKVVFYIENSEISSDEFFDLLLKTNGLVAQKYNESTFFITTELKAKQSNYTPKFPKTFTLNYISPEEALYALKSVKKFRDTLDFDNISVFDFDKGATIIRNNTKMVETANKDERYSNAIEKLKGEEVSDIGASAKDDLMKNYVSHITSEASKSDIEQTIDTEKENGLAESDNPTGSRPTGFNVEISDMRDSKRKVKALFAYETRENLNRIESFIKGIDIKRKQVIISMKVMQMNTNYTDKLGIDTTFDGESNSLNVSRFKNISEVKLESTLNFLEEKNNGKVIAKPTIRVVDGHSARIEVTRTFKTPDKELKEITDITDPDGEGDRLKSESYQLIDTFKEVSLGLTMLVVPSITPKEDITLDISVDELADGGNTPEGFLIESTRKTDTVIRLKNGETIVLGGLINVANEEIRRSIPLVSRLPGVGRFFRHREKREVSDELVIFLTGYVDRDEEEQSVSTEKQEKTRTDFSKVVEELKYRLGN